MKSKLTTMTIIMALIASTIYAQNIPQKISFQGRLIDANTKKPVTAEKNFTFKIGDWIEEHKNVQVSNGLYSVILGSINPIPLTLFNDWQANMKILVDGKEMAPDIEMASVPYAFECEYSNSLNGSLKLKIGKHISWLNIDNSINTWLVSGLNGLTYQFLSNGAGGGNVISIFKTDDEKNVKSFSIGNYTLYGENNKGFQLLDVYGSAYIKNKIGIGKTNPSEKLEIASNKNITKVKLLASKDNNSIIQSLAEIEVGYKNMGWNSGYLGINIPSETPYNINPKRAITFLSSGNIGIGTTTPQAKLDIHGNALLGFEYKLEDFGAPLKSGFYYGHKIETGDIPDSTSHYTHLIASRHGNQANNYQFQIASSYSQNDRMFFRKIAINASESSNPIWHEIATRGKNTFSGNQTISGEITCTKVNTPSDIRYKKNITPIQTPLQKVTQLKGVNFEWKTEEYPEKNFSSGKQIGMIAQDVEKVIPEIVHTDNEGMKSISYDKITAVLVEAIKELKAENEQIKEILCEDRPNHKFCTN